MERTNTKRSASIGPDDLNMSGAQQDFVEYFRRTVQFHDSNTSEATRDDIHQRIQHLERVNLPTVECAQIKGDMEDIISRLCESIHAMDERFSRKICGIGSVYEGTNVGQLTNEFDYRVFFEGNTGELELDTTSLYHSALPLSEEHLMVRITDTGRDRFVDLAREEIEGGAINPGLYLSVGKLQRLFRSHVSAAMETLQLPSNWHHGGFQRPVFGGYRSQGVATLLQFTWTPSDDSRAGEPLEVTVDLVPALAVPDIDVHRALRGVFLWSQTNTKFSEFVHDYRSTTHLGVNIIPVGDEDKNDWKICTASFEMHMLESISRETTSFGRLYRTLKILLSKFFSVTPGDELLERYKSMCRERGKMLDGYTVDDFQRHRNGHLNHPRFVRHEYHYKHFALSFSFHVKSLLLSLYYLVPLEEVVQAKVNDEAIIPVLLLSLLTMFKAVVNHQMRSDRKGRSEGKGFRPRVGIRLDWVTGAPWRTYTAALGASTSDSVDSWADVLKFSEAVKDELDESLSEAIPIYVDAVPLSP